MKNRKLISFVVFLIGLILFWYLLFNSLPFLILATGNIGFLIGGLLILVLLIYSAYRLFKWGFSTKE